MNIILIIGSIATHKSSNFLTDVTNFLTDATQVKNWATAISLQNPKAFVLVESNELAFTVPLVSQVLKNNDAYDAKRICGITKYDVSFTENLVNLQFQSKRFHVPVIGGQGRMSVPLLSQAEPPLIASEEEVMKLAMRIDNIRGFSHPHYLPRAAVAVSDFLDSFMKALDGKRMVEEAFIACSIWDTPFFNTKVRFGTSGVEVIYPPNFSGLYQHEMTALENIKVNLLADIESGKHFAGSDL